MREHRLIERFIVVLRKELEREKSQGAANVALLDAGVDFFRTYADRTHHGKEEDILFRDLDNRKLSMEHRRIMDDLIDEHVEARAMVTSLLDARGRYEAGDPESLDDIVVILAELAGFYPVHIEKEDKRFFFPCMDYFTGEEQAAMLDEFWEFDRMLIHEKYRKMVELYESE